MRVERLPDEAVGDGIGREGEALLRGRQPALVGIHADELALAGRLAPLRHQRRRRRHLALAAAKVLGCE